MVISGGNGGRRDLRPRNTNAVRLRGAVLEKEEVRWTRRKKRRRRRRNRRRWRSTRRRRKRRRRGRGERRRTLFLLSVNARLLSFVFSPQKKVQICRHIDISADTSAGVSATIRRCADAPTRRNGGNPNNRRR